MSHTAATARSIRETLIAIAPSVFRSSTDDKPASATSKQTTSHGTTSIPADGPGFSQNDAIAAIAAGGWSTTARLSPHFHRAGATIEPSSSPNGTTIKGANKKSISTMPKGAFPAATVASTTVQRNTPTVRERRVSRRISPFNMIASFQWADCRPTQDANQSDQ